MFTLQLQAHDPFALRSDRLCQLAGLAAAIKAEIFRLERFPAHRIVVVVIGQLVELELPLARLRQGHDAQVAADQHGIAVPGHPQVTDLIQEAADSDVDTADAFEHVPSVNRRHGRHHPALPGRIEVDVGPHHLARGVVPGVGQVIEVVAGDVYIRRVLLSRIEPGVDMVVAVPAVEIEAGDQRVAGVQLLHQRVEPL